MTAVGATNDSVLVIFDFDIDVRFPFSIRVDV